MKLRHDHAIALAPDQARAALWRPEVVLPAIAAGLERDDDGASGSVTVRLGSMQVTYRVRATTTAVRGSGRRRRLVVTGSQARGDGDLAVDATVELLDDSPDSSRLRVSGELTVTGRGAEASDERWESAVADLVERVVGAAVAGVPTVPGEGVTPTAAADNAVPAGSPATTVRTTGITPTRPPEPTRAPLRAVPAPARAVARRSRRSPLAGWAGVAAALVVVRLWRARRSGHTGAISRSRRGR